MTDSDQEPDFRLHDFKVSRIEQKEDEVYLYANYESVSKVLRCSGVINAVTLPAAQPPIIAKITVMPAKLVNSVLWNFLYKNVVKEVSRTSASGFVLSIDFHTDWMIVVHCADYAVDIMVENA